MPEPTPSESTSPVNRPLMAADLAQLAEECVAAFVPLMAGDLGRAAKLLRVDRTLANQLLGSDLTPRISALLERVLGLPDAELVLIVDAIALRLAAWRRVRDLTPPGPELAAAVAHLRAVLR